jgi:hypothetical protein
MTASGWLGAYRRLVFEEALILFRARHRSVQPIIIGRKPPEDFEVALRETCGIQVPKEDPVYRRGSPVSFGRWAILREPDQQHRDAKEHQGHTEAFEREGYQSGGCEPQSSGD